MLVNHAPDNPGDSREQREAEIHILSALGQRLHLQLCKKRLQVSSKEWLEVDGSCESPLVWCEAWAHHGAPRSAQKNKVMADAFKLLYAERFLGQPARKILAFGDTAAARRLTGENWMARALETFGIEVLVRDLKDEIRNSLRKAQRRQYR
jgi:hypothetical protein